MYFRLMKKLIFHIILNALFLIPVSFCFSQNRNIDSLLTLVKSDKTDTNKVKHLNDLAWALMYQNPDTAIILGNLALKIISPVQTPEFASIKEESEDRRIRLIRANISANLGSFYYLKTDYFNALNYYQKGLKLDEGLKNKKGIAKDLGNIGNVFKDQGDYPKALGYYFEALKMAEELGYKQLIANTRCNIGIVYRHQGDYPKALNYYFKSLEIAEELGNLSGIAKNLGNIGVVYTEQNNFPKALEYDFKALEIAEELGDKNGIARQIGNIGTVYNSQNDFTKALEYGFKALKIAQEIGDKNLIAINLGNIGLLSIKTGKFIEAERYLKKAIALDDSIGVIDGLKDDEEYLSQLYDTTGRYKLALIHYKKAIALKDTIFSQENKKQLIRKEMNYEFDKKEAATKAEHDKEIAVAVAEKKKQQIIIWSVIAGLLLVIVFASFVFRSLRITRKQKNIIELQKNEVDKQKEIVEKQKEKIVDSITYAQRIQQSILMEESEIQTYLPECFIYFQPKDIVSGDFYWCSKTDDKIIIAAVDCTGHGVPGAFMSMIGNTLLNQIVNEKHITKPSEILHYLNLGVYEALHQKKDGALSDDGMDIALCTIDYKNNEIQYAGQNPLYVLSDGKIEVIKGDIYGIGGGGMIAKLHDPLKKVFANHVIPIKKGMSIYLSTDGYMDQFGGSDRKKYGAQRFKDLLSNNLHLNMQQQKELMVSAHAEWKGNTAQIDDVLVIGVRL